MKSNLNYLAKIIRSVVVIPLSILLGLFIAIIGIFIMPIALSKWALEDIWYDTGTSNNE